MNGGPGNDRIHVRDGEADTVDCGDGFDIVLADDKDVVASNCEVAQAPRPTRRTTPTTRTSKLDPGQPGVALPTLVVS